MTSTMSEREKEEEVRGARIAVNPRVSVGYTAPQYQRARQDRNMTNLVGLEGLPWDDVNKAIEGREEVDWQIFPPNTIATYSFGTSQSHSRHDPLCVDKN